jgi:hypothetical protein
MYRFFPLSIVVTIFYYYNETLEQNKFRLSRQFAFIIRP